MGLNTAISLCNDTLGAFEEDPKHLVELIREGMVGNTPRKGGIGVVVHPSEHADVTQLVAVGGNYSTRVHALHNSRLRHDTQDGQLLLLESWAAKMGYQLVPRVGRR